MEWDPQSDALLALRSLETIGKLNSSLDAWKQSFAFWYLFCKVSLATVGVLFYHYLLVDSFNFATQVTPLILTAPYPKNVDPQHHILLNKPKQTIEHLSSNN